MTTTVTACLIGIVMFGLQVLAWIASVKLGTRWAGIRTSWSQVTWLAVLVYSLGGVARVTQLISFDVGLWAIGASTCFVAFAYLAFPLLAYRKWFSATAFQTFKIWLASLLASVAALLLALFVRQYFLEAFSVPTNAMAPTIVGRSVTGRCPECGETTYRAPPLPGTTNAARWRPIYAICENFHTTELATPLSEQNANTTYKDRVLVSKLIAPERWDVIVFKNPASPQYNYVKRVIGFPGETLQIKDGVVWIDHKKCEPPEHLEGLRFESDPSKYKMQWLSGEAEITLGADEYFVLGDNTLNAYDSRLWSAGAPGRPPYAVPQDHLVGVVTHIYWPKNRMRILK